MKKASLKSISLAGCLALLCIGCGSGSNSSTSGPSTFALSVSSVNPTFGVVITASPLDLNGAGAETTTAGSPGAGTYPATGLTYLYAKGTSVTLTAQAEKGGNAFFGWVGCDSTSGLTCTVAMSADKSVQAQYPGVSSLVLTPISPTASLPSTIVFTTTVNGIGNCTIPATMTTAATTMPCSQTGFTYALTNPTGVSCPFANQPNCSGTITPATATPGVTSTYTTAYPAPTSVIVTVASVANPAITAQTTITLDPTASTTTGPTLSVDLGSPLHAISPYIYGINDGGPANSATFPATLAGLVDLPIERWGGNQATRYNYTTDTYNTGSSYYENVELGTGAGLPDSSTINTQLTTDKATNTKALVTVPLIGWATNRSTACGYSVAKYGPQTSVDTKEPDCGNGTLSSNNKEVNNDPTDTSTAIDQTFAGDWVTYLVGKYGTAANGGVAIYGLDNEPEAWRYEQQDVQSFNGNEIFMSYDSVTNSGLAYAAAIKTADPTALVSGPVIGQWQNFFTSVVDQFDGYDISPYCQYDNQLDYQSHGSVSLIPYYLQQFAKRDAGTGTRTLDYLDLHTGSSFAPSGVAYSTAGPALLQQERLESTRVFWDPTYTDYISSNFPDVITGDTLPNGQTNTPCTPPLVQLPPMLIPRAQAWVNSSYPGTKVALTTYNWGGLESINGALAQADLLGIFGRQGLDMAMLDGAPDPKTQFPGVAAFQMYTNYDGKGSKFGDMALTSASTLSGVDGETYLAVYGAQRTSDKAITVMVINKGTADQSTTVSLLNTTASGSAASYQYLPAGTAVTAGPAFSITAPASGSTTSTITGTFPAQSITLLIIPQS